MFNSFARLAKAYLRPCTLQRSLIRSPRTPATSNERHLSISSHTKMEDRDPLPITATPAKDQLIAHEGKPYTTVKEGRAHILVPPNARTSVNPNAKAKADEEQKVFYNPIQQFNRDLSVLAIKAYGEDLCRRKTIARERRKKGEEAKRERKKLKKGEQAAVGVDRDPPELANGNAEAAESTEVHEEGPSKKRKRADEDDEDIEDQARKVQKGGDLNGAHDGDIAQPSAFAAVDGTDAINCEPSSDTFAASTEPNTSDAVEGAGSGEQEDGAESTAIPPNAEPKAWQPSFRILDALSATGLRALRYATEIPSATSIVANDRDRNATAAIALNVQNNSLSSKISTSTGDAMGHMYGAAFPPPHSHGPTHINGRYDVIDLDPYGTAAPFIDAALQALNDEGMLCVTCTDSGVFASCGYSEKTFYGGMPIKGTHAHEGGLRLILHAIATSAARYSLAIEPLLSLSIDFYARVFIRVRKSPADVKFLAGKTMLVYECDVGCGAWSTQFLGRHQRHGKGESSWKYHISMAPMSDKLCEHCGSKMHIAGPMWGGPLHNAAFIEKILDDAEKADKEVYQTLPRIEGMLDTALSELQVIPEPLPQNPLTTTPSDSNGNDAPPDGPLIPPTPPHIIDHHPFYFVPSAMCKVIKAIAPPEAAIRGALRRLGYVATRSHAKAGSLKTDAPWNVLWEVLREWVRLRSPVTMKNLREGGPGWTILEKTRKGVGAGEQNGNGNGAPASGNGNAIGTNTSAPTADATMADASNADTPNITVNAPATVTAGAFGKPQAEPGKELDVSKLDMVFDEKLGQDKGSERKGKNGERKRLVRYQQNPRENWGPMARARGGG